jgi:hypothetical protein
VIITAKISGQARRGIHAAARRALADCSEMVPNCAHRQWTTSFFGSRLRLPIEFEKGKNAIAVPSLDKIPWSVAPPV